MTTEAFQSKTLEAIRRFDVLPDDAVLPSRIAAILLGCSERCVRYHPDLERRWISRGRYGFRVGNLRRLMREGASR
jgi:hypothetical protein